MDNRRRRWARTALGGVRAIAIGVGFVVLLAGGLGVWYFIDRGTKSIPGALGSFTRIALDIENNPFPIQRSPSARYGAKGVETAVRQGVTAIRDHDSRPEVRNAVLEQVSCRDVTLSAEAGSDQRFSCRVTWKGFGETPILLLDIRNGQLVPVAPTGSSQGATTASSPPPCSPASQSEITQIAALAEGAGAANRKVTAVSNEPLDKLWVDRFFASLRNTRLENARAVDRLVQFEAQTDPGRQLKTLLVGAFRGFEVASTRFLGNARTVEEWIVRPKSWVKALHAWRAAVISEQDRLSNFAPPCA